MSSEIKSARIAKEMRQLNLGKGHHGFNCELNDECLLVKFPGPTDTVYENETFELRVRFDDMYPFAPPRLQLITGIYHPNIDKVPLFANSETWGGMRNTIDFAESIFICIADGKICLNILNMPPEGAYNPTITIESIIVSVQLLISSPNPYDPLRGDAASDFLLNKQVFDDKVRLQIEDNKKVGHTAQKRKYSK